MSEDERTLWCGNLSEKVTEEMLYELFLQAGPVENVKIPRDSDKRQRSYAFITYVHACSVEYAMDIFEGSSLFKRTLTLHRKNRNGPNPAASPKINFINPTGSGRFNDDPVFNSQIRPTDSESYGMYNPSGNIDILSGMARALNMGSNISSEMLMQLGQQMLGASLPAYEDNNQQKDTYRAKMNYHDRHQKNPYSRDERYSRHRDRNDTGKHHRHDNETRRGHDRSQTRDHRRRR